MAFPSVVTTATTNGTGATTTPSITMPSGIVAGDLLIVLFRTADGSSGVAWPGDWTELVESSADASNDATAIGYKQAAGSDTLTLTTASAKFAAIAWRISGAEAPATQAPQISTAVTGSTDVPDPGSLSPTGGARDYLWLWMGGWEGEQTSPPASNPTNYSSNILGANSGTGGLIATNCRVASASRNLNAASDDPGSWTISVADDWTAWTLAVHPASVKPFVITDIPDTRRRKRRRAETDPLNILAATSATGTIASTLPALTAALVGEETFTGTIASTLPAITAALAGAGSTPFVLANVLDTRRRKRRPSERDYLNLLVTTLAPPTPAAIFRPPLITKIVRGRRVREFTTAGNVTLLGGAAPVTGTIASTLPAVTAALVGAEEFTGTIASTLPVVTAALAGAELFTGTIASTLPAVTAALAGEGSQPFVQINIQDTRRRKRRPAETDPPDLLVTTLTPTVVTGTIASTLPVVTAALAGAETFTGTIASTLPVVTAALAGEETISGTVASTLPVVTAALAGAETFSGAIASTLPTVTAVLAGAEEFTGTIAATLPVVTAALEGLSATAVTGTVASTLPTLTAALTGEAIEAGAPVFAPDVYVKLAKRRRKKRKDLEELRHDLRVALGLAPAVSRETKPELPEPPEDVPEPALPFLVALDDQPLRVQVDRMLAALRAVEDARRAAWEDDEQAIEVLLRAA